MAPLDNSSYNKDKERERQSKFSEPQSQKEER